MNIKFTLAVLTFALSYLFIVTERLSPFVVAILGATSLNLFGVIDSEMFFGAIEWDVIFLLIGMMIVVHILSDTGIFEWVAIRLAQLVRGEPFPLLILLCFSTAIFSAFLDNVTTILVMVPVSILLANQLNIDSKPFVIAEVIASNIGGTATLIGDPPNLIIGAEANLAFNDFLFHLFPISMINLLFFFGTSWLLFSSKMKVSRDLKAKIMDMDSNRAIKNSALLKRSSSVAILLIFGFLMSKKIGVEPGILALMGASILLLISGKNAEKSLASVEWHTIFLFIGLFVLVEGLKEVGCLNEIAKIIMTVTGGSLKRTSFSILWFSGILSSILDNIPYTTTMVPVIKDNIIPNLRDLYPHLSECQIANAIWWPLAMGACFGGNGTLIGASANVVAASLSEKSGCGISFWEFTKYGMLITIQTMLISSIYIWFRYL